MENDKNLRISRVPVSRENQPWCFGPVDSFKMVDQIVVLYRSLRKVVLGTHHHKMDTAIVKSIPTNQSSYCTIATVINIHSLEMHKAKTARARCTLSAFCSTVTKRNLCTFF